MERVPAFRTRRAQHVHQPALQASITKASILRALQLTENDFENIINSIRGSGTIRDNWATTAPTILLTADSRQHVEEHRRECYAREAAAIAAGIVVNKFGNAAPPILLA